MCWNKLLFLFLLHIFMCLFCQFQCNKLVEDVIKVCIATRELVCVVFNLIELPVEAPLWWLQLLFNFAPDYFTWFVLTMLRLLLFDSVVLILLISFSYFSSFVALFCDSSKTQDKVIHLARVYEFTIVSFYFSFKLGALFYSISILVLFFDQFIPVTFSFL